MNFFGAKIPFLVKIHLTQNNQTKERAAHEFVHECRTQLCQKFKYVSRMKLNSGYCKKYWTHSAVAMTYDGSFEKKQPNMNKCFGIQLKLHDISWWLARIFIHVQWTMDSIYLWQQKKNCMHLQRLHLWNGISCYSSFWALFFFISPIQSIENKTLEHS